MCDALFHQGYLIRGNLTLLMIPFLGSIHISFFTAPFPEVDSISIILLCGTAAIENNIQLFCLIH